MTDRELMQQALHWLDDKEGEYTGEYKNLIEVIKARLAQPEPLLKKSKGALSHEENKKHNQMIIDRFNALQEQEPVAWWHDRGDVVDLNVSGHGTPLYFSPPKKEWVGLTDYEIVGIASLNQSNDFSFARAIEAKLKEKNT